MDLACQDSGRCLFDGSGDQKRQSSDHTDFGLTIGVGAQPRNILDNYQVIAAV